MKVIVITDDIEIDRRIIDQTITIRQKITKDVEIIARWNFGKLFQDSVDDIPIIRIPLDEQDALLHHSLCGKEIKNFLSFLRSVKKSIFLLFKNYCSHKTIRSFLVFIKKLGASFQFNENIINPSDIKYLEILKHKQPDVIHAHDLTKLHVAVFYARQHRVKIIYDAHELFSEQPWLSSREKKYYQSMEKKLIHYADEIITVNEYLAQEIKKKYNTKKNITVIENSVRVESGFDIHKKYNLLREKFHIHQNKKIILYQGNFTEFRHLKELILAMHLVKNDNFVLVFLGDGYYKATLERYIQKLELRERVFICPRVQKNELLFLTASADIGIIPYPYGNDLNTHFVSPNKFYEFIAAGIPIISNKLPFLEKKINQYGLGYVDDIQTPEKLAALIEMINIEDIKKLRNNLISCRSSFLCEEEHKKLVSVYGRIN